MRAFIDRIGRLQRSGGYPRSTWTSGAGGPSAEARLSLSPDSADPAPAGHGGNWQRGLRLQRAMPQSGAGPSPVRRTGGFRGLFHQERQRSQHCPACRRRKFRAQRARCTLGHDVDLPGNCRPRCSLRSRTLHFWQRKQRWSVNPIRRAAAAILSLRIVLHRIKNIVSRRPV